MKTRTLILIVFLCSLFRVQAQVFPESDAIWNIQEDYLVGHEQELINEVQHYGLFGDTIINGITYNKLYLLNDTILNITSADKYLGGFRQEEKKIWFRPSFPPFYPLYDYLSHPEETLLYDFSKNVGDTIWHNIISGTYYWTVRDSASATIITSIDVDELGRKYYHTCQFEYNAHRKELGYLGRCDSWIDGIGSVEHGLFWFLSPISVGGFPKFHLACFKQGNEVKYMDNPYCSCFCNSSVGISEKNNILLEVVYGNNCIRVQAESPVFPCELRLFSLTGQLISEKILQSGKDEIPVNQKGVLLYQARKNGEVVKIGRIMIK